MKTRALRQQAAEVVYDFLHSWKRIIWLGVVELGFYKIKNEKIRWFYPSRKL